jgi:uncharacterized membrane protein
MKIALLLHLLGAVIWIGGMFFAYFALRPAAAMLDPAHRLPLWTRTLERFFRWVWIAVALILGSGFYMLTVIADHTRVPFNIHLMLYVGLLMSVIFAYVFFSPLPALKRAAAGQDWNAGAAALNRIRRAVAVNLALGLVNLAIATVGQT